MKNFLSLLFLVSSLSVSAADVCVTTENQANDGGYTDFEITCTNEKDSFKASATTSRAKLLVPRVIKEMIEKGYEVKSDGIFVRN